MEGGDEKRLLRGQDDELERHPAYGTGFSALWSRVGRLSSCFSLLQNAEFAACVSGTVCGFRGKRFFTASCRNRMDRSGTHGLGCFRFLGTNDPAFPCLPQPIFPLCRTGMSCGTGGCDGPKQCGFWITYRSRSVYLSRF